MRNNPEQANIDFETNTLHTVIDQEYTNMFSESPCKLALRKILGEPEINALETGLAIKFTKTGRERTISYRQNICWMQHFYLT